jgi:cytidyltransferase-like protein
VNIVLAHGVFDCLHYGHLYHLMQAKAMGDWLVVNIVADEFVTKKLVCKDYQRQAVLQALRFVDHVHISDEAGPESAIKTFRPKVYVRGYDYAERLKDLPEYNLCLGRGIKVEVTNGINIHSTSFK